MYKFQIFRIISQIVSFFNYYLPIVRKKIKGKEVYLALPFVLVLLCGTTIPRLTSEAAIATREWKFGAKGSNYLRITPETPDFSSLMKKDSSSFLEEEFRNLWVWSFDGLMFKWLLDQNPGFKMNGFFWPTEEFVVTDSFWVKRCKWKWFNDKKDWFLVRYRHSGVDLKVKIVKNGKYLRNSEIFSVEVGEVVRAGWYGDYGICIDIRHVENSVIYYTRYAHLSKLFIKKGYKVEKGERIGRGGNTGRSRGDHLHFEIFVKINGRELPYDPLCFFPEFRDKICYQVHGKRSIPPKPEKPETIVSDSIETFPDTTDTIEVATGTTEEIVNTWRRF